MSLRNYSSEYTVLSAKGATGIWNVIPCKDYKDISISYATDGWSDAALTVKFQGAVSDAMPNFAAAQSVTNMWDYIEVIDTNTGSAIDWDTWVAVATADDYRQFEANINGLNWFSARVTARTAGEITVKATMYSDN